MSIKGMYATPKTLANGRVRYYYYAYRGGPRFWISDDNRIDLPGKRLPPEFVAAYNDSVADERMPVKDTFAYVVSLYRSKSQAFKRMKVKGQTARIKYLDAWQEMQLSGRQSAASAPITVFDNRKIIRFITSHRDKVWGHSPSSADEAVLALSAFLTWCKKDGRLDWNRAQGIESLYHRPTEARIWSNEEQTRFTKTAPIHLKWAFQLLLHTGLRREDLTRLPMSAITNEHLLIPTGKSRGRQTALIPITPPLRSLLSELDQARRGLTPIPTTILFSSYGRPWTAEGFSTSFDRHRAKINLGPKDNGPTIHDMRKTCATNMIILQHSFPDQISDQFLIDLFGWTTGTLAKMKRIYVSDQAVIDAITSAK